MRTPDARDIHVHGDVSADLDLGSAAIPLAPRDYRAFVTAIARSLTPPPP